ncbi:O-antigen ligase family protein [Aggregatilinea lenta]|uniref:O-antigen ligase family protein n=1 Tax=Aggregatilinea lenta TaxID=913108 RepID=UPI000E5A333C|nr:O-antigen ligase family protein [Aggregatilinea lenta]
MGIQLSLSRLAPSPIAARQHTSRGHIGRPFTVSSIMLAVYVFTIIAWSQVSEQSAQYSRLAGLALTYVFLVEFLLARKRTIYLPTEVGPLVVFLLWCVASLFWANGPAWSLMTIKTLAQLIVFWIISVNVMVFYGSIIPAIVGLLAGLVWAIFNAVKSNNMSLSQTTDTRIASLLSNANLYAVALGLGILASLYLYRFSPLLVRWFLIGFIILAVQQIFFFSGSRKGMIGVVLIFGFYWGIMLILNGRRHPGQIILFLLGIVVAYIAISWLIANSPFGDRLLGYRDEPSFLVRENLFDYSLEHWEQSPIIGHGAKQFTAIYERDFGIVTYSHSNYLEILVNNGVVGLLIFYSFYALIAIKYAGAFLAHRATVGDMAWAFTLIALFLMWDFAMVSLEEKLYWTMFAQLTAHCQILRRRISETVRSSSS